MSEFSDYVRLIEVLIWPIIILTILWLFRKPIKEIIKNMRITKFSAFGITLELADTREFKTSWKLANDQEISGLTRASDFYDTTAMNLINTIASNYDADYAIIDLGTGNSWLTSRLFIFTTVFEMITDIKCLVFVGSNKGNERKFIGYANLKDIHFSLAERYPWLEVAFIKAYADYFNFPPSNAKEKLLDLHNLSGVSKVVRSYLDKIQKMNIPIDLENWVNLDTSPQPEIWENARWIDKTQIKSDLRKILQVSYIEDLPNISEEEKLRVIFRRAGDFVALVGKNEEFKNLIDRRLLVEKSIKRLSDYK